MHPRLAGHAVVDPPGVYSLGTQVVQAPGNAQGAQAITPVMKDFARKGAWRSC